jgi:hypothetical protein
MTSQKYFKHFADKTFFQILAAVPFEKNSDLQKQASFQKVKGDNRPKTAHES